MLNIHPTSRPAQKATAAGIRLLVLLIVLVPFSRSGLMGQNSGSWSEKEFNGVNAESRHESAFVQVGNKFYLIGGRGTRQIQVYDPVTNTLSNTGTSTSNIHHFQAVAYNGKIYIIGALQGGYPDEDPVPNVLIYDPVANQMSTGATIPLNRRRGSAAVVVHNNKFYMIAGNRNGHSAFLADGTTPANVSWLDEYNPQTGTWTTLPDAPRARDHFFAQVYDNKIYVVAGRRSRFGAPEGTFSDTEAAVDVYDFGTGQWLSGAALPDDLPTERAGAPIALLGNELIVMGGEVENNSLALPTTEALNLTTGNWRSLANLTLQRHATQAIVYNDDIYIAAGSKTKGGTEITNNEVFMEVFSFDEPSYFNWTNLTPSNHARSESQTVTYQGEMYCFNGFAPNIDIENSVEKYNPQTDTWTALAPMPLQGNGQPNAVTHNGIALVGDVVWIIGGRVGDNPGPVTNKVWLYDISANQWSAGPALPIPAAGGGVGRIGRKIHYVGGLDTNASCDVDYHLVYDLDNPGAGWQDHTATSPMPIARNHFGTVVLDGKLYTIGGQNGHDGCGGGSNIKPVHVYDPVTDQWTRLADFPRNESHLEPSTFAVDGKIYVIGGQSQGTKANVYDPQTDTWSELTNYQLPQALLAPNARIFGQKMVVANGGAPSTSVPVNTTRVKDFTRNPLRSLSFHPGQIALTLAPGETETMEAILSNLSGDESVSFSLNTGNLPGWLTVNASTTTAWESFAEIELTIDTDGLNEGTYNFTLIASANGYNSDQLSIQLTVSDDDEPNPEPEEVLYRVNAGGTAQTVGGVQWQGCNAAGSCAGYVTGGFAYAQNPPPAISGVSAPLNQAIYQTEWTGGQTNGIPPGGVAFGYNFPVPAGTYLVRLYFAELNKFGAGLRVFDVELEGAKVLNQFDIFSEAGGAQIALSREFEVTVSDGNLDIDFIRQVENAKVSAIEILEAAPSGPVPFTAYLEAECGTVGSNWLVEADAAAAGGYYVTVQPGLNATVNPPADIPANQIVNEVTVPENGDYHVFARVYAANGSDDSFWVKIDNGNWIQWWQGLQTGNAYAWKEVLNSPFALSAGSHEITFAYREDGARLDKLMITNTETVPTGLGDPLAACVEEGNDPPTAVAAANPPSGTASLTVQLDGSGSTDPDGTIVSYAWAWSAGTAGGESPSIQLTDPGTYAITLTVTDDDGATDTDVVTVQVNAADPCGSLPQGWTSADIGAVGAAGSACYDGNAFTVAGSGSDIWGTQDEFHFVYQTLECDGELITQIASQTNTNAWAKAGLMMRNSLAANSALAMVIATPSNGVNFQYRTTAGGAMTYNGSSGAAPVFVRLVREGNTFTGYKGNSVSGPWTSIGSQTIQMGSTIYAGLAVTSHNDGTISTAEFAEVQISSCEDPVPSEGVISLTLINAVTDNDIQQLNDGDVINLGQVSTNQFNIRATTNPAQVGSVGFVLSGPVSKTQTENVAPYALFGDNNGNYNTQVLPAGEYTLSATAFTGSQQQGTAYPALNISFTLVNGGTNLTQATAPVSAFKTELHVFPNPAREQVRVEVGAHTGSYDLEILDLYGRRMLSRSAISENTLRIDLREFPGATYFLVLRFDDGQVLYRKFVVQE
jgi:N-acetylneuraminic acid mutarotase